MKTTLQNIKEEYAAEKGLKYDVIYKDWDSFSYDQGISDEDLNEISKRYAKSKLEEAAEKIDELLINSSYDEQANDFDIREVKQSILETHLD